MGGDPSPDAVAQRAGIATLYRHFPDEQALLRAVVLHVLDRTIEHGDMALAESAGLDPVDERAIAHRQLNSCLDGLVKSDR